MVDAAAHDPNLLPGEPRGRTVAHHVPGPHGRLLVPANGLRPGIHAVTAGYVELHAKSFYSFGMGASHVHELLSKAVGLGYPALALTDTNLCGALEFARLAGSLGIQPITGGELTLLDGSRLVMLARTREGYANISRLFTLANSVDRRKPRLDPAHLREYADGACPAHRRAQRASRQTPVGRPPGGGQEASQGLHGVVWSGIGVCGAAAELPPGGHGAQPGVGEACR